MGLVYQNNKRLGIYFLLILFVTTSCRKDYQISNINNLNNNHVAAIGHGGSGIFWKFPINSYPSVEEAIIAGADGIEVDVQLTADNKLIAFHNLKLEEITSDSGFISNKTAGDLKNTLYNSPISSSIYLQSVEDLISLFPPDTNFILFLDCKLYADTNNYTSLTIRFTNSIEHFSKAYAHKIKLIVESQDVKFLSLLKNENTIKKLYYSSSFTDGLNTCVLHGFDGLSIDFNLVTKSNVTNCHQKNKHIVLWNVQTDKENTQALDFSPITFKAIEFII